MGDEGWRDSESLWACSWAPQAALSSVGSHLAASLASGQGRAILLETAADGIAATGRGHCPYSCSRNATVARTLVSANMSASIQDPEQAIATYNGGAIRPSVGGFIHAAGNGCRDAAGLLEVPITTTPNCDSHKIMDCELNRRHRRSSSLVRGARYR